MVENKTYDLVVIGGGPAGMMAAGRAAELGARVVLLEKNPSLGKKLLITGGGRCNLTNAEFDVRRFLTKLKASQKFLFSPFSRFGVAETLAFFNERGMPTKIEAENRAFPESNSARSVWEVLVEYMEKYKVRVETGAAVSGFACEEKRLLGVKLKDKRIIRASSVILATGGSSRPETGSTGEGFDWLAELGHTVIKQSAAIVPVKTKEKWAHALAGVALGEAKLTAYQDGKKMAGNTGKLLFTHYGLSGPLALNMSREIGELLGYGAVTLGIDLLPGRDMKDIDTEILALLQANHNKRVRNSLPGLTQTAIMNALIKQAGIDPEKPSNSVTREERQSLIRLLKHIPLSVSGLMGLDKAVVTSGGVKLEEVDFKTMRSKLYPNLYLVGDVLNIDRPSGGYSLQLCWTTGFVAGSSAAETTAKTV